MPDRPDPEHDQVAQPTVADAGVDLGRRSFFRRVAGDLVQTAASLTGAATVAQAGVAGVAAAARELGMDGGGATAAGSADSGRGAGLDGGPVAGPTMEQLGREHLADGSVAWAWEGDRLLLLDQRRLPGAVVAFPVASAGEAARAIGERVIAGPAAAIVAAWGLALTADAAAMRGEAARGVLVSGGEQSLRAADPGSHVLRRTLAEMVDAIRAGLGPRATAGRIDARIRAEHAALGDALAAHCSQLGVRSPLLHGPGGALWGGGVGGTLHGGLRVAAGQLFLTEGRPWLDGARVSAWELARRGAPATLITDAAAPGLIVRGSVDAVLCSAERVAADGSVSVAVGALGIALAAMRVGVPFIVVAAPWTFDAGAFDATALAEPAVSSATVARFAGTNIAPPETTMDGTRLDLLPADLMSSLVTLP